MEWRGPTDGSKQPQGYGGREGEVEQKDQKIRKYEDRSETVIGALIEVHRALGPGLLESAYEACFCHELRLRGLAFERQRRDFPPPRPSTPLSPTPSSFLIFPIFLSILSLSPSPPGRPACCPDTHEPLRPVPPFTSLESPHYPADTTLLPFVRHTP